MRREGMAQRMRGRGLRQPERAAQPCHRKLDDARGERAASGADEQGTFGGKVVGAERDVFGGEPRDLRQYRDHPRLVALAGDRDDVAASGRRNVVAL